jgi:hypothetical protein
VAEVPIERVGVKAKGRLIARCGDEAPRCRGGATHGNGLGTCHSKGASMVVEEDATAVTKFGFVRVITEGLKVISCLFVGDEVEQSQELAVDAARGSHTRWQEGHVSVLSVRGAVLANLFSSGAVKYFVRIIRVAKLTLIQAVVPSTDEVLTQGDVHEEIDLLCNLNVEDLKISTLASTQEHPLVFGGVTGIADALERRHDVIVRSSPIGRMSKACIDVVPCTITTHKVPLASA